MAENKNLSALCEVDSSSSIWALIITGTLGVSAFLLLPSIILGLLTDRGFTEQQIGTVSTCQLVGLAAGSVLCIWLLKLFTWRDIARLGIAILMLADFGSVFIQDYTLFLAFRFIAGLAGGVCVSFAAYAFGQTSNADRNFGLFLAFQVAFAMIGSFGFPSVIDLVGVKGVFGTFVIIECLTLVFIVSAIPVEKWQQASDGEGGNDRYLWILCSFVLIAIIFFFIAIGGFWTYIAPIAIEAGFTKQQTGTALGIGQAGGLIGAYVAAVLNIRFGRAIPMISAVSLMLIAISILASGFNFVVFVMAVVVICFGWYLYVPFQFGLLAAIDRDGRPMVLLNAFAGLGSGIGPAIIASFLSNTGFDIVYSICGIFFGLSLVLHLYVIARNAGHTTSNTISS